MALNTPAFHPYPLAAISPRGWLAQQLRIQADGLSGHLDEFWPDIQASAWIGGEAEGWERMPYWLDGVIPLAWLLDDAPLKQRLRGYLDYIITHQHADGWLGPRIEDKPAAADLWSQLLALKMLVGYADAAGDGRVPGVVESALRMLDRWIDRHPLSYWGQFRWFEGLIAIYWLYERQGSPWLLELAVKLQAQGFHWQDFFEHFPLTEPTEKGRWNFAGHVVNNAMATKAGALWWRISGKASDRQAAYTMIAALDRYHGMSTGVFSGDECLAGLSPTQGTELCAVAEYMYSLEWLAQILGDPAFADRLESIAYNALPATFAPDMWSHQYDQQVNQIECSRRDNRTWNTNGPEANLFGLEPNYGCCTANLSQAWPKFAAHLWMQPAAGGIAALAYAPSRLATEVDGVPVTVELQTNYPFGDELHFTVSVQHPHTFPLLLRVPAWAESASLEIDGRATERVASGASFLKLERLWQGDTPLSLSFQAPPRLMRRPGNAVAISRGALIFALKIGESWRQINADKAQRELPHADWEVYPTTAWNYALDLDEASLPQKIVFERRALKSPVFSPENAPLAARVRGRRLPGWKEENGSAGPTPPGPVQTSEPLEEVLLIPYGCTALRIAEFPLLG